MKKDSKKALVIDKIAPVFYQVEIDIINHETITQKEIEPALFALSKEKGRVFDDIHAVLKAVNSIIKEQVISSLYDKLTAGFFNENLIINYPLQLWYLLDCKAAEYVIMASQVNKKPVYLLISYVDWNNYYGGDEIDIGSDDLPF